MKFREPRHFEKNAPRASQRGIISLIVTHLHSQVPKLSRRLEIIQRKNSRIISHGSPPGKLYVRSCSIFPTIAIDSAILQIPGVSDRHPAFLFMYLRFSLSYLMDAFRRDILRTDPCNGQGTIDSLESNFRVGVGLWIFRATDRSVPFDRFFLSFSLSLSSGRTRNDYCGRSRRTQMADALRRTSRGARFVLRPLARSLVQAARVTARLPS